MYTTHLPRGGQWTIILTWPKRLPKTAGNGRRPRGIAVFCNTTEHLCYLKSMFVKPRLNLNIKYQLSECPEVLVLRVRRQWTPEWNSPGIAVPELWPRPVTARPDRNLTDSGELSQWDTEPKLALYTQWTRKTDDTSCHFQLDNNTLQWTDLCVRICVKTEWVSTPHRTVQL